MPLGHRDQPQVNESTIMGESIFHGDSSNENSACERTGTNGSGLAILKLFAVAYAASNYPDCLRARRAVRLLRGAPEGARGRCNTRQEVLANIALNRDGCFGEVHV